MSRSISSIIWVICPVARGDTEGGSTPRESYASSKARSYVAAHSHHGRPASAALFRILSSMSVTFRTNRTS
ncbi:Uncharacterised protein [Mycobacteroides abscessus subsp. abscessus]|nr:Uncharacterised protein [Mycobacteroides abscessus subsp. abscessus]SKU58830.1 Uncharacterised protein [Mycobacteroides abscessus subsp. abscessus]